MARKLDESEKKQMNLDTLQKEDPDITDILGNASHTAIYRFNNGSCQWERVGVEGAAFVVAASVRPLFRLVVFNKLDVNSYNLDLSEVNKVKLQPPYLMLRLNNESDEHHSIMGLWFHENSDRNAVMEAIQSCMNRARESRSAPSQNPVAASKSNQLLHAISPRKETKSAPPEKRVDIPKSDPADADDFLRGLSERTTSFHTSTHVNGKPKSNADTSESNIPSSISSHNVVKASDKSKAILSALTSKSAQAIGSASTGDGFLTDKEITAVSEKKSILVLSTIESKQVDVKPTSKNTSQVLLIAPSDLTGRKREIPKLSAL